MSQPPLPAIPGEAAAWAIAAVPLLVSAAAYALEAAGVDVGSGVGAGGLAATVMTMRLDRRELRAAGYAAPSLWWALLPPVYLWKRANLLHRGRGPFWLMAGTTAALLVVAAAAAALLLGAQSAMDAPRCEEVAADVVRLWNSNGDQPAPKPVIDHLEKVEQASQRTDPHGTRRRDCSATAVAHDGTRQPITYTTLLDTRNEARVLVSVATSVSP